MFAKLSIPLLLFIVALSFSDAIACSCGPSAPCKDVGRADVVFVGTVVGSKYQVKQTEYDQRSNSNPDVPKELETTYDIGEIYFEVIEAFKGTEKGKRLTVYSDPSGAACGSWFKRGQSYVILARYESSSPDSGISSYTGGGINEGLKPDRNRLWTGLCSGNREIDDAAETLSYLRSMDPLSPRALIVGTVYESINDYTDEGVTSKAYPNIEVRAFDASNPSSIYSARTDNDGRFVISAPPGRYIVKPELSRFLSFEEGYSGTTSSVEIDERRCEIKTFFVSNSSIVSGTLVDSGGIPQNEGVLDLVPVGKKRGEPEFDYKFATVEEDGSFSFTGVPPGQYYLSLNYARMPDEDSPYPTTFLMDDSNQKRQIIDIVLGTKIEGIKFPLPSRYRLGKIKGKVQWKNGKPANGAEVELYDVDFDRRARFDNVTTDAVGNFAIEWFAGRRYKLKVVVWQRTGDGSSAVGIADAETAEFVLDNRTAAFRIVLDQVDQPEKWVTRTTVRAPRP